MDQAVNANIRDNVFHLTSSARGAKHGGGITNPTRFTRGTLCCDEIDAGNGVERAGVTRSRPTVAVVVTKAAIRARGTTLSAKLSSRTRKALTVDESLATDAVVCLHGSCL